MGIPLRALGLGLLMGLLLAFSGSLQLPGVVRPADPWRWQEQDRLIEYLQRAYRQPPDQATRIVRAAFHEAQRQQLAPELVLAVIAQESAFKPYARSRVGAQGLMQVLPRAHPELVAALTAPYDLLHIETNIRLGTRILAGYLGGTRGDLAAALRRYSGNAKAYAQKVAGQRLVLAHVMRDPDNGPP